MAKVRVTALLVALLLACAGCSAFFNFNAFAALDTAPTPVLLDYQGAGGLSRLASDLGSPAVVAQLAGDSALVDQIKSYLQTTYLSAPLTTPDQQRAAALYSDLSLATTSGDTLVNNVVTTIMSPPATGNIASLISSIIPASVLADTTGVLFAKMVQGLLDANNAYILLGNSLPTQPSPPGVNLGDVAQKAAVAYLMSVIVNAVTPVASPPTQAEAVAEMFKLVTNDSSTPPAVSGITLTDPLASMPSALVNIFNAAGMPLPA